jgi:putative transposase
LTPEVHNATYYRAIGNPNDKKAYEARHPKEPLILHTDRGVSYTSKVYNQTLRLMNITHSYSGSGNPYDNSVYEAFFKTLK